MEQTPDTQGTIARYAIAQSVAEIAIGSIVHALNLPLGGHLLSLNQGFLHTLALKRMPARRQGAAGVSAIASSVAVLKGLSPAGKRLGPMLAISVQGALYSLGVAACGANLAGAILGCGLLSLWGFAQPLLVGYLFFGSTLFQGLIKIWSEFARAFSLGEGLIWWILAGLVALKLAASASSAWIAWRSGSKLEEDYLARLKEASLRALPSDRKPASTPFIGAVRDLLNPWFLFGTALSAGFLFYSDKNGAPDAILYLLRVLAIALLFFWAMRAMPSDWLIKPLGRFPHVQSAVREALVALRPLNPDATRESGSTPPAR